MKRNDLNNLEAEIQKIEEEQKVLDMRILALRNTFVKMKE